MISSLLKQANEVREQDKLAESLALFDQATIESIEQKDYSSLVEALHGKVLSWKHFYLNSHDPSFRIIAQDTAKTALKICQDFKIDEKLSVSYFRIGEMDILFENYQDAISNYQKSLEFYGAEDAQKGDYTYHLGEAIFRSGDSQEGEDTMLKGLEILKKYQEQTDPFLIHVWISGCYLRLAELTHPLDATKSQNYFNQAKEIIDSDQKLIIRRRQMQTLAEKLHF